MQTNNSILFYECCFIFHFVLQPSREKQTFLLWPQHWMWRTIRVCEAADFSFKCKLHGTNSWPLPQRIHPARLLYNPSLKDGSSGSFPCFFWRCFQLTLHYCQDSGPIFNSLVFTCSIWYFHKELEFLRRCSKTHLWVGGLWILLLWIVLKSAKIKWFWLWVAFPLRID